mgnify:CR=1 FL=1|jgi:hypothetical protein
MQLIHPILVWEQVLHFVFKEVLMAFSTFKQKADSYYEFLCDEETDL